MSNLLYGAMRPLRRRPHTVRYLSAQMGITEEELLDLVRRRKLHRKHRKDRMRKRSNGRTLNTYIKPYLLRQGEEELGGWLRALNLSTNEFCELAGISRATFEGWEGIPSTELPLRFLELYAWAKNVSAFLRTKGFDPNSFHAEFPMEKLRDRRLFSKDGLIIRGLTPEERAKRRSERSRKAALEQWAKKKQAPKKEYRLWNL